MTDWEISKEESELIAKYKCTASSNGGWCNGARIGSRMKCPKSHPCGGKARMCDLGFQRGLTEMDEQPKNIDPKKIAATLGCKANCLTCSNSFEDRDGDYGEIFCGTICTAGKSGDEIYLEDAKISLEEEKSCWEPHFWKLPGNEFCSLIGDDGNPTKAYEAFWAKIDSIQES